MGRYKSVLMSELDAKAFPHHVDIPVPPIGLGTTMDLITDWLNQSFGSEWRAHGVGNGGGHVARYMFRTQTDADLFDTAWRSGQFSRAPQD